MPIPNGFLFKMVVRRSHFFEKSLICQPLKVD